MLSDNDVLGRNTAFLTGGMNGLTAASKLEFTPGSGDFSPAGDWRSGLRGKTGAELLWRVQPCLEPSRALIEAGSEKAGLACKGYGPGSDPALRDGYSVWVFP